MSEPASQAAPLDAPPLEAVALEVMRGDRRLFSDLSFSVNAGTLLHVEGHNGSGKTTLLRVLCGLLQPQEGEVRWQGGNIRSLREEFCKEVLYFGHLNGIKNDLTGIENLRVSATLDGDAVEEEALWAALSRMGLAGFEDLPTKVLSQGQKKRVALARLMLSSASVWVLDEPFTALDVKAVAFLESLIAEHVAGGGMAIITTHQEVALTSGTVERLRLGR
ncbi:cytochrome c biogenesis heme-transporting ATPase CcmA [Endothiovibrio diazotrophicus]